MWNNFRKGSTTGEGAGTGQVSEDVLDTIIRVGFLIRLHRANIFVIEFSKVYFNFQYF